MCITELGANNKTTTEGEKWEPGKTRNASVNSAKNRAMEMVKSNKCFQQYMKGKDMYIYFTGFLSIKGENILRMPRRDNNIK